MNRPVQTSPSIARRIAQRAERIAQRLGLPDPASLDSIRVVATLLYGSLCALVCFIDAIAATWVGNHLLAVLSGVSALLMSLGILAVVRRRSHRTAGWSLLLPGVPIVLVMACLTGGLQGFMSIYFVVLPALAGVLLGDRWLVPMSALTALAVGALVLAEVTVGAFDIADDPARWIYHVLVLGLATTIVTSLPLYLLARGDRMMEEVLRGQDLLEASLESAQEARAEAEQASQAKSMLLERMNHELRTPLHVVLGVTGLEEGAALTHVDVALVRDAAKTLLHKVETILEYVSLESIRLERETVELCDTLAAVAREVHGREARGAVSLELSLDEPVWASVDIGRLRSVIEILLDNAYAFTSSGAVRLGVADVGGDLHFWVEDTGVGIPAADRARIFQPFEQFDGSTTRSHEGTGMGLALASKLMSLHGGTLMASAGAGGRGTRIEGRIAGAVRSAPVGGASVPRSGSLKVLVVDDNPVNLMLARRMLENLGHEAHTASSGVEALGLFDEDPAVDFVFMDVRMPELDGVDCTRHLRARHGERVPPIVALTADASHETKSRCLEAGMVGVVTKPAGLDEMASALERHVVACG